MNFAPRPVLRLTPRWSAGAAGVAALLLGAGLTLQGGTATAVPTDNWTPTFDDLVKDCSMAKTINGANNPGGREQSYYEEPGYGTPVKYQAENCDIKVISDEDLPGEEKAVGPVVNNCNGVTMILMGEGVSGRAERARGTFVFEQSATSGGADLDYKGITVSVEKTWGEHLGVITTYSNSLEVTNSTNFQVQPGFRGQVFLKLNKKKIVVQARIKYGKNSAGNDVWLENEYTIDGDINGVKALPGGAVDAAFRGAVKHCSDTSPIT